MARALSTPSRPRCLPVQRQQPQRELPLKPDTQEPVMRELSRPAVVEVLDELSRAVGADAGSALYAVDGEGVLQLAGSAGHEPGAPPSFWQRLRGGGAP